MKRKERKVKEKIKQLLFIALTVHICGLTIIVYDQNQRSSLSGKNAYNQVDSYTLYIGTNDKDTYESQIEPEKVEEIVNRICLQYVDGYTIEWGKGAWVDEHKKLTKETTLILTIQGVNEEILEGIMNNICVELNQKAILVEYSREPQKYYYWEEEAS